MTVSPTGLWQQIAAELNHPDATWQLASIAVSIGLGWLLARAVRLQGDPNRRAIQAFKGMRSFAWVLAPLFATALLFCTKLLFEGRHQSSLIQTAITLLGSFALIRIVFYMLRRVFARHGHVGGFLLAFEKVFALLVWAGVAVYVTGLWPRVFGFFDSTLIPFGRHQVTLLVVLQAGASVGVTLVLALWGGALLEERLMRLDTMHSSLRAVMARTVRAVLIVVAILLSLSLVGIDLTVLSVFGGALGVGLGLGLQKIVSSYFSGFVILLERSLAIGDIVKVEQYQGQVTRINTRYTVLQGADGVETVVPNEMLVSQAVQNYSLSDRKIRLSSQVTVGYETNLEALFPLLVAAIAGVPRVCASPVPQVLLLRFGADGLELEINYWMDDPENGRNNLISEVNRAVWALFLELKVSIPYPQRVIKLSETPLFDVGMSQSLADKESKIADKAEK